MLTRCVASSCNSNFLLFSLLVVLFGLAWLPRSCLFGFLLFLNNCLFSLSAPGCTVEFQSRTLLAQSRRILFGALLENSLAFSSLMSGAECWNVRTLLCQQGYRHRPPLLHVTWFDVLNVSCEFLPGSGRLSSVSIAFRSGVVNPML